MVVNSAVDRVGRLDILVNNAGRGMKYVSMWLVSGASGDMSGMRCARVCAETL
jgi:NAD(P)-dependent dehydrogenase (short-subunit alcohol dehydrogenase family)